MVWSLEKTSPHEEARKIWPLIVPYTRGRCLDIGSGPNLLFKHFIRVDSGKDFGGNRVVEIKAEATDLSLFSDESMDGVFSSHCLEHVENYEGALREWWRVIKPGGHLTLYLPHADLYPRVGEEGANPDHAVNLWPHTVIDAMRRICEGQPSLTGPGPVGGWDLVESETRNGSDEYSMLLCFKKRGDDECHEAVWQRNPGGKKRVLLSRFGGVGDQIQVSSVLPGLKAKGYHVTFMTTPEGQEILKHDPHIDEWWLQDRNQVQNELLPEYLEFLTRERFDELINLSESIEGELLAMPGRPKHFWSYEARRRIIGPVNYLERLHDLAGVPGPPKTMFYPTPEEGWAAARDIGEIRRGSKSSYVVGIALAGSSVHKAWPWVPNLIYMLLKGSPVSVVTMGDERDGLALEVAIAQLLLKSAANMAYEETHAMGRGRLTELVDKHYGGHRLRFASGLWPIRQSLTFTHRVNCMFGPETGLLNVVGMERDVHKLVMLSHSSRANLTKHWVNTESLLPAETIPCYPCHRLHPTAQWCPRHSETGASICAASIEPGTVYQLIMRDFRKTAEGQGWFAANAAARRLSIPAVPSIMLPGNIVTP